MAKLISVMGYACGTCRMGSNPATALDLKGRSHEIDNLYIADASVFPELLQRGQGSVIANALRWATAFSGCTLIDSRHDLSEAISGEHQHVAERDQGHQPWSRLDATW